MFFYGLVKKNSHFLCYQANCGKEGTGEEGPERTGGHSRQGTADIAQPQETVCAGPPGQNQEGNSLYD